MDKNSNTLQEIIRRRRSTRTFTDRMPARESIQAMVASAIYAPYGGATGIPLSDLRKIYVFKRSTPAMKALHAILYTQLTKSGRMLNRAVRFVPPLKKKMGTFAKIVQKSSENGIPAVDQAAYIMIIAEKKGFPPVEKQSLAHAMQNMWLTATGENLGFQMVSAISLLAGNKDCMALLGLKKGEYALDGCAVGISVIQPIPHSQKEVDSFVKWM